ncbi:ABC transporter permease subunit, partial [Erwinia amylovora]|uniref:ABC transporter permease subunit n=1 Tax=Erwinia amylovora TaxID=552 RepID=UPI00200AAC6B
MQYAGMTFTIPLTLIAFTLVLSLGIVVALARLYGPRPLQNLVSFYVWLIRGTPLLVQLFMIFYALPGVGITIDAFPEAVIVFTLNIGAYTSEIIR